MSKFDLDLYIPTSILNGVATSRNILIEMFINSNEGNYILDFISKLQNVIGQYGNTPGRRESVEVMKWKSSVSYGKMAGFLQMKTFINQLYKPSENSQQFVKIAILLRFYVDYFNKAYKQFSQNRIGVACTPTFYYNLTNRRAYINSIDTIDSFLSQFQLFSSNFITFGLTNGTIQDAIDKWTLGGTSKEEVQSIYGEDINSWDVSKITNMDNLFKDKTSLGGNSNRDISFPSIVSHDAISILSFNATIAIILSVFELSTIIKYK